MEYPLDPSNPLLDATSPLPGKITEEMLDDFDIINRMELVKATAPFYANDLSKWKDVLDELYDWVYDVDGIEFESDATESES